MRNYDKITMYKTEPMARIILYEEARLIYTVT